MVVFQNQTQYQKQITVLISCIYNLNQKKKKKKIPQNKQQKSGQNVLTVRDPRGLFFLVQIVFVVLTMFQIWRSLHSVCQKE